MTSGDEASKNETLTRKQNSRAQLRESFLRAMSEFSGETCNILTYEQSYLQATFYGWRPDGTEILVRDLRTPAGIKMPAALLRTPDILAINFDTPKLLP